MLSMLHACAKKKKCILCIMMKFCCCTDWNRKTWIAVCPCLCALRGLLLPLFWKLLLSNSNMKQRNNKQNKKGEKLCTKMQRMKSFFSFFRWKKNTQQKAFIILIKYQTNYESHFNDFKENKFFFCSIF